MSTPNLALADELEAVNSIYDPGVLIIVDTVTSPPPLSIPTTSIILTLPNLPFSFLLSFPPDYPDVPLLVIGTQSTGANTKKGHGEHATNILRNVLGRVFIPGQVCLFDLIEETTPLLQATHQRVDELSPEGGTETGKNRDGSFEDHHQQIEDLSKRSAGTLSHGPTRDETPALTFETSSTSTAPSSSIPTPNWITSDPLIFNKSTFIARALLITSLTQTKDSITHLLSTNKKVASATHNINAWRIKQSLPALPSSSTTITTNDNATSTNEIIIQDSDDDGETAAGSRLLHLMQLMDVWNVLVVVTRWYGGVKLGPDRFRLINQVARDVLVKGGFVVGNGSGKQGEEGKEKGKGKGKGGRR